MGLNAVLRYMDAFGNWQVYNAFAGNEVDPNGNIYTSYDPFGLVAGSGGLYLALFNVEYFPPYYQSTITDPNWASTGGTTPNSAFAGFTAGKDGASNNVDANYSLIMKSDPRTSRFGLDAAGSGVDGTNDFVRNPGPTRTQINNTTAFGYSMATYVPTTNVYRETVNAGICLSGDVGAECDQ